MKVFLMATAMSNAVFWLITLVRFKVFRLMSLILLGKESASAVIGQCVSSDLEFSNQEAVRSRVSERKLLSEIAVQRYELTKVPACWAIMFSRTAIFPVRYGYVLDDVVVGPDSGVMHIPPKGYWGNGGIILIPSVCHPYFLFQDGVQEVMRRARSIKEPLPICPMPVIGYYHEMFEGLIRVFIARRVFGNIKVLVSTRRSRHIDEMLALIGVTKDQILYSDCPVRVKKGVLIPRWSDCGENLKEDVCEFRDYLVSGLPDARNGATKLYISRAKSRRSLPDEHEIERVLADRGFSVVYFEDMSFVEQLRAVRSDDIIVSPHGAGLSNLIVAKPNTKVIEIMTQGWANSCYGHLASSLGLDYTCIDAGDGSLIERLSAL